jgi:hypothetical protein
MTVDKFVTDNDSGERRSSHAVMLVLDAGSAADARGRDRAGHHVGQPVHRQVTCPLLIPTSSTSECPSHEVPGDWPSGHLGFGAGSGA